MSEAKYVASCSFGKDSLAMVLMIIEKNLPLDEVLFYDTGMEFESIYRNRDRMIPILKGKGIKFTEIHPQEPFLYRMLDKPIKYRDRTGYHYGYGWCGGPCRWATSDKITALTKATKNVTTHYVGIAADELPRLARLEPPKVAPLAEWGVKEKDALEYCFSHGWNWLENNGDSEVELYSVLDRVSCWCCANKNKKELRNIWKYLPEYWKKLLDLQSKIDQPMKWYYNKKYGWYGNLFELQKVFETEI